MRYLVFIGLAVLVLFPGDLRADSNRDRVRSLLEVEGWTVRWLSEFAAPETRTFNRVVAASRGCLEQVSRNTRRVDDCLAGLRPFFRNAIQADANTISRKPGAQRVTADAVIVAILQSLHTSKPVRVKNVTVHAGLAIYSNWRTVSHKVPVEKYRVRKVGPVKTKVPYIVYENREQRISLPKTYQPYIRYQLGR